jgi:hypothetical protein
MGDVMEHYSLEQWADFARQVTGEQDRAEMQNHLDNDGCRKCSKILGMWKRVHAAARREQGYQPPDSAVRSVKGTFAIHGRRPVRRGVGLIAELLFDTGQNRVAAGVRSAGNAPRQLLYSAGVYRIDVRIEPQADSGHANVAGQVLNSAELNPVDAVRVALLSDRKTLSESVTGQFGEFQLVADPTSRFHLKVYLPGQPVTFPAIEPAPDPWKESTQATDSKTLKKYRRKVKKRTRKKV